MDSMRRAPVAPPDPWSRPMRGCFERQLPDATCNPGRQALSVQPAGNALR